MAASTINPEKDLPHTKLFLAAIQAAPEFSSGEIFVTRAPGRLDLMGGIADYSGSLVLQLPIANATHAALQLRSDSQVEIVSLPANENESLRRFTISLAELCAMGYDTAREFFRQQSEHQWAAYVAGAFVILAHERGVKFSRGATILLSSNVPEGKGVSSSAALEVATMSAIEAAYGLEISAPEIGFLCQKVENLIAGAPCGVMDQLTSACGEANKLLALLCQPGELQGTVDLPTELAVWGIDSGVRHSVGGADYGTVRTAAFMGYRLIADIAGLRCMQTDLVGKVEIADPHWRGYLANITPEEFELRFASSLPRQACGEEFLAKYKGITDRVTSVQSLRSYPVLQATKHPIYENARVQKFREILQDWRDLEQAAELGELMYGSHESYSACGLGSEATDEIVALARATKNIFGAKITGGGSGGTVAILGTCDAHAEVQSLVETYVQRTRRQASIISGSSNGANSFGHLRFVLEK